MGIKDFSKTFNPNKVIMFKDIKNTRIAFDIMSELWRAALGTKNIKTLTDKYGNSTVHISVILSNIIQLAKNKVEIIGCFDYNKKADETYHNPIKYMEIKKRQKSKDKAKKLLDEDQLISDNEEEDQLISDNEDEKKVNSNTNNIDIDNEFNNNNDNNEEKKENPKKVKLSQDKKAMLEKQAFSVNSNMINDIKFLFDCFNIKYLEAPKSYEGEYMCSYLEKNKFVDGCFSNDTDLIAFGCKKFYRRNPRDKKIYIYTQENVLEQIGEGSNINDIRKIAVILGCDFCDKTKKIGPKTIFSKYKNIELNEQQQNAYNYYSRELDNNIEIINSDKHQFVNCNKDILIDWLVNEKSFNRDRITKQLEKI
jgi:5'-3' exonuclease